MASGRLRTPDLVEEVVDVGLDGALADEQGGGDVGVGEAAGDEGEHLGLPGGEPAGGGKDTVGPAGGGDGTARAATRRRETAASKVDCPAATARRAAVISARPASLVR
jgi:hypothetical protein